MSQISSINLPINDSEARSSREDHFSDGSNEDPGYATVDELNIQGPATRSLPPTPEKTVIPNIEELYARPKKPKQVCSIKPSEFKTERAVHNTANTDLKDLASLDIMKKQIPVQRPPKLATTSMYTEIKAPLTSQRDGHSPESVGIRDDTGNVKSHIESLLDFASRNPLQDEIDTLQQKVETVVHENRLLQWKIDELVMQQSLQSNERYKKERNEIEVQLRQALQDNLALKEQFVVFQRHMEELQEQQRREVLEVVQQLRMTQREKEEFEAEYQSLAQEHADLKERHQHLVAKQADSVPRKQHVTAVGEINRLFKDLKKNYNKEMERVHAALRESEMEKNNLQLSVTRLEAEAEKFKNECQTLSVIHGETVQRNSALSAQLEAVQNQQKELQQLVSFLAQLVEQGNKERETFISKIEQQAKEHQMLLATMMERTVCVGKLQERLKTFKAKALDEFQKVESRLIDKQLLKESMRHNFEREINHLRHIQLEKQREMDQLHEEKRKLECALETLWQSFNENSFAKNIAST